MIKSSELRLGNFVLHQNEQLPICSIHSDETVRLLKNSISIGCFSTKRDLIEPIPLTPEILENAGFEFKPTGEEVFERIWKIGSFEIWEHDSGFCHDYCNGGDIHSLHQLQNLYFALTGEELDINL